MDIDFKVDVNIISTCHGCLSSDRKISSLGESSDMLLVLLGSYGQCLIYGTEKILFCWECRAMLKKLKSFQQQVRTAQAGLMEKLNDINSPISTLSKLVITNQFNYDQDIKHDSHLKSIKNNDELLTTVKIESEDINSYSGEDDNYYSDHKDDKVDEEDKKLDEPDNKINILDTNGDHLEVEVKINIDDKDSIAKDPLDSNSKANIKDKTLKTEIPALNKTSSQKKDTQSITNSVAYYKRFTTLVKSEKIHWGSSKAVRAHFDAVEFSEKDMEEHIFSKYMRNLSHKHFPHKCDACCLGYFSEDDLWRHNDLNHHQEGTPYKCSLCSKRQASAEALEQHWRTHSVVYRCKSCSEVCKVKFMRRHLQSAHTKTYDCNVCHMKLSTLKLFALHYKERHLRKRIYICDHCNQLFTTKKTIVKHLKKVHTPYTCKDCNKQFENFDAYKANCLSQKEKCKNNPELSFCVECNKQFPSIEKYRQHLKIALVHNKSDIACPECGKIFCRKKNLTQHYNLFHLKKTKYYCEICDKYFARLAGLRLHKENVHLKVERVKNKVCDLCGRAFVSLQILRNHRLTHTGERPHKCPHCEANFTQKWAMYTHVRSQHKDKHLNIDTKVKDKVKA